MTRRPQSDPARRFFAELRGQKPPPFDALWAGARRRARPRWQALWAPRAAAAAAALALVLLALPLVRPGADRADPERLARELSSWEGPMDFLLDTPGVELFELRPPEALPLPPAAENSDLEEWL